MPHERLRPSFAFTAERIEELRRVVPEAFADGKVNWTALREALGDWAEDEGETTEHFGLTWPGKREARRMAALPSQGTLVPMPGQGINEETTRNIFIEGDNLEVLKLLRKSYVGRVKMIYVDPPYNTGNDFIYEDDFKEPIETYLRRTGQLGEDDKPLSTNTRADGRFHSKWLSMMYPRLRLVRSLLKDDGVVFVSIDDVELSNLIAVLNEVFGEENRVGVVCWKNVTDNNPTLIVKDNEFILCYAKTRAAMPAEWKSDLSDAKEMLQKEYDRLRQEHGRENALVQKELREFISDNSEVIGSLERYKHVDDQGVFTGSESVHNTRPGGYDFEILHPRTGRPMRKPSNGYRFPEGTFDRMVERGEIIFGKDEKRIVKIKKYLADAEDSFRSVIVMDGRLGSYDLKRALETEDSVFSNPKPVDLMKRLISFSTDETDIIVDLFAGSGSLAHAAAELNVVMGRRNACISIQWPEPVSTKTAAGTAAKSIGLETIAMISRHRLRLVARAIGREGALPTPDVGHRLMVLKRSNFTVWSDYDGDNVQRLGALFAAAQEPLLDGWNADALSIEVMLLEGFPLDSRLSVTTVGTNKLLVAQSNDIGHRLVMCFDSRIAQQFSSAAEVDYNDVLVCLDSALTDAVKLQLADRCLLKTI